MNIFLNEEDMNINEDLNSEHRRNELSKLFKVNKSYDHNNKNIHILDNPQINFDNLFEQTSSEFNNKSFEFPIDNYEFIYKINSPNIKEETYIMKKRNRRIIFDARKMSKEKRLIEISKKKLGRKRKSDLKKGVHNRLSQDNIANKIKGYFFRYVRDVLNKNLLDKKKNFFKLSHQYISDLKKSNNENLFEMKIKDIISQIPIAQKYKKYNKEENKILIDNIYKEKKEKKVKKILELTFNELFIIFRNKLNDEKDKEDIKKISKKIKGLDLLKSQNYEDFDFLIKKLEKRNANDKNKKEYDEYIQSLIKFCCNYEKWFIDKIGRNTKK